MSDSPGVPIGKAAALYGLAPSAVRWWESQGVLPEPPRVNGRRVYSETELRRIGLAYLCCMTGAMPLEKAAVVLSGSRNDEWRSVVRSHAGVIEEKIRQLQGAHEYLRHLMECPDDDIVEECSWLDGELMRRTPRRRAAAPSLVDAAETLRADGGRDETGDETTAWPSRCTVCGDRFTQPAVGRRRRYCSRACQQRRYRQKTRVSPRP
ncbi:MerR family transcriptional regulator [Amycolatopsis umgeniensis]|uniref:DNA-binding transcriptional MerR regulator n=1 Tax=Amycolatopsis umgeniensis TaxID=336628 RepID=A0A841B9Y1_9PSEU|nr:MerR family transcriptional regulator [Amycolatopsis umgeniensis]MBB5855730.1 DNA-binding transcriptional MerR regulator [Amycolatopsis umgeniensis]